MVITLDGASVGNATIRIAHSGRFTRYQPGVLVDPSTGTNDHFPSSPFQALLAIIKFDDYVSG